MSQSTTSPGQPCCEKGKNLPSVELLQCWQTQRENRWIAEIYAAPGTDGEETLIAKSIEYMISGTQQQESSMKNQDSIHSRLKQSSDTDESKQRSATSQEEAKISENLCQQQVTLSECEKVEITLFKDDIQKLKQLHTDPRTAIIRMIRMNFDVAAKIFNDEEDFLNDTGPETSS